MVPLPRACVAQKPKAKETPPPPPIRVSQIENAMFLNKMKEQEKNPSFQASSTSHYQTTVLAVPGPKQEGGGQGGGGHLVPPHSTQNITVVPVSSTGIMTAGLFRIQDSSKLSVEDTGVQTFLFLVWTVVSLALLLALSLTLVFSLTFVAGLVITTPQGTLVSPASSSQSFVPGHPATTMIVSALHAPNTGKTCTRTHTSV